MKKLMLFALSAIMAVYVGTACVVAPAPPPKAHRVRHVSEIHVKYVVRGGVRVYLLPKSIRVGDVIIVNGKRCTVRKMKRNRVRIVYPDGTKVWIRVEFK